MELRVLKYFLMTAREENITKAAQLLHITQPTLSRQLMQLEDELGVRLFERSNHHIILTDEGMLLQRRAQEIVSLEEKTKSELTAKKELSGEIEIGSGEFKSFAYFSDIMARFVEENPNIRYKMYSGNGDNIKERIDRGLADIGLLSDPVDISRYEFIRLPEKEKWGILIHEDEETAKKEFVTPEDLMGMRLFMPHRRLVQNELENWFGGVYDKLEICTVYDLLYNAAVMVRKRIGVALTIELESRFDGLKFIPLYPKLEFGSVLVWKKNRINSPAVEAFIDFAKQCIKSISDNTI